MEKFKTINAKIAHIIISLSAAGLLLMTLIIGWQVFGRYILKSTPNWSEQLSLILMIWYVSLASAAGVREGFHIRIITLQEAVSPRAKQNMEIIVNLIIAACGLMMCIWGMQLVIGTWSHAVPSLGFPRGAIYIALPLSGMLIILFCLERLYDLSQPTPSQEA